MFGILNLTIPCILAILYEVVMLVAATDVSVVEIQLSGIV